MTKIEMINLELDLLLDGIENDLFNKDILIDNMNDPSHPPYGKYGARFIVSEIKRQILEL